MPHWLSSSRAGCEKRDTDPDLRARVETPAALAVGQTLDSGRAASQHQHKGSVEDEVMFLDYWIRDSADKLTPPLPTKIK
ncbi:hypothetical protein NDU88_005824 [Pleurodeles waltl]|uniref:Uncharacterized protein n=1 Tax=Pleurodeles waltl TaxID=8319 RepID=A0AAV7MFT2_PLEWA|nr:hypothetical protein NDU88_005824 [Pleurodeles waltl]